MQQVEVARPLSRRTQGRLLAAARQFHPVDRALRLMRGALPGIDSEGIPGGLTADVIHFLSQRGFSTPTPTVYTPHDLQHRHHPEFFAAGDRNWRERTYRARCQQAAAVTVMSDWGKADLVDAYDLDPRKVHVVPWASVLSLYPDSMDLDDIRIRLGLPERYALFPARPFPHKNHRTLFEALGELRRRGMAVPLVCTGTDTDGKAFRTMARSSGVEDLVLGVGFVSPAELKALYRGAQLLVFPSLFEGFGMPILEALDMGVPVAASMVTSIPELARDAAEYFDPTTPMAIADVVGGLWADEARRAELTDAGRHRAQAFSWKATGEKLVVIYSQVDTGARRP